MDSSARASRFDDLYSSYGPEVYGYARRHGADRSEAEDVLVETFLVCWRRLDEAPTPALPWLLGVTRRVLANRRRGQKRHLALHRKIAAGLQRHPTATANSLFISSELKEAMASLCDQDRKVLALVAWQGLTHREAAAVMGCSRNALTKRYLRACRHLRAQLPSDWTYTEHEQIGSPTQDPEDVD
jgi:RNA polymerase sigma factor (sigma-70 family)